ncbi:lysophospholipid acyltransferase family protein [Jannaschia rubra]|uniref:Phospholipid/glycerol acyltransferase domain-containing protein n=1 Tax=Jannaschia rubra TaxID=282197 RepID=A0A0M6XTZ6_9RHOB|nr:lysophospholipid acyltransferase family protein [Jannaschia rubra]CTQ34580.1 hypothetical protein JAN5088_03376 [Jannaschia rubra]SFG72664.1 1-acyl-sn-glycerol-3-phosphate acyltransferase [Jannaschia rubra]
MTGPAGDPVALRSPAMVRFFDGVMQRQMRRAFRAVRVAEPGLPALPDDRPVVFFSNHPSWWDPAFYIVLSAALLPGRCSFGPMEARALERYRFMRRIGIFGIEPGTTSGAARLLRVGGHILSDPAHVLWLTAQGHFADPRTPVELQRGLSRLLSRAPQALAVPVALEYPFWSEKRPEALAAFGDAIPAAEATHERLEQALQDTANALAARAKARSPAAFDTILGGRVGVGGIYGGWSRLRARIRGRSYRPEHLPESGE